MPRFLPLRANLEWLRKSAKDELDRLRETDGEAKLHQAQLTIARGYGFPSWRAMVEHVETVRDRLRAAFPALRSFPLPHEDVSPDDPDLAKLLAAIKAGAMPDVLAILSARPILANAYNADGWTPLHVAAEYNDAQMAIVLLAHDADPDQKIRGSGHNALSWAVTCNAMDFARALRKLAATPDFFTAAGIGALTDVQAYLDNEGNLLPDASQTGSSRWLPDGTRLPCPPPNAKDQVSDALYIASRNKHVEVVRFLLTKNPDVSFQAYLGGTPLHWAYFGGSQEVVDLLLKAGADPNTRDPSFGALPALFGICAAASWGLLFRVKELVATNPALVHPVSGETSALHEAAASGQTDIVRFLLEQGADPTTHDFQNRTPKDRAAAGGHAAVLEVLNNSSL